MSTSHLSTLHSRLAALRRRRWLLRIGTALGALVLAVLWTLCVLYVVDWTFELDKPLRAVLILTGLGAIAGAWTIFGRPYLGQHETELDMALLVERQQKIDTDLVAAIQFESPQAARWGSSQLETAVIDYVAEFSKDLDVFAGLSTQTFARRLVLSLVTLAIIGVWSAAYPAHLAAFLNRLAMGSKHYPTRTSIDRIVLNETPVESLSAPFTSPYWEPLKIEAHCSGEVPTVGEAEVRSRGGVTSKIVLTADASRPGVFVGQLDRLVDSVTYQLYLGDAWTDPAEVLVIPLPVVDLDLRVTPPSYASLAEKDAEVQPGSRQVAVVEGSRLDVHIKSDKRLKSATLSIGQEQYPLKRDGGAGSASPGQDHWLLDPTDTPLAQIVEPLKYELQVEDTDGLRLKDPIQGFIRIKADRPPRVSAAMVTQHVLPAAKPSISYGAADDYGVARLRLHRQVVRQGARMEDKEDKIVEDTIEVPVEAGPKKVVRGRLPVDLGLLKLLKGDQLKLTFEAIDHRGALPGKSALSEPLVLHVTDERGVLAAMVEADERSARQLDAIIQRQLGIGESP